MKILAGDSAAMMTVSSVLSPTVTEYKNLAEKVSELPTKVSEIKMPQMPEIPEITPAGVSQSTVNYLTTISNAANNHAENLARSAGNNLANLSISVNNKADNLARSAGNGLANLNQSVNDGLINLTKPLTATLQSYNVGNISGRYKVEIPASGTAKKNQLAVVPATPTAPAVKDSATTAATAPVVTSKSPSVDDIIAQKLQLMLAQGLLTGPAGPIGPTGPAGLQGPLGPAGPQGPAGSGIVSNGGGRTSAVVGPTSIVTYIPANPPVNNGGSSIAGFTTLSADTFNTKDATLSGSLAVTGTSTLASLTASGAVNLTGTTTIAALTTTTLNPGFTAGSIVFQGASNLAQDNANFFWDDTNNRLGIGTASPGALLDVRGAAIFNEDGADADFRVEGDTDANLLFIDASTDRVGIGTATPSALFSVGSGSPFQVDSSGNIASSGTTGVTLSGVGADLTFTGTGNHDVSASSGTLRVGASTIIGNVQAVDDTIDIGTAGVRFDKIYANEVNASILVGTISGGHVQAETLSINSDNATADTEDAFLAFERGTVTPNALLQWDATSDLFDFNSRLRLTGTILGDPSIIFNSATASDTDYWISLQEDGAGDDDDTFQIGKGTIPGTSSFVTINKDGNVGIGTSTPMSAAGFRKGLEIAAEPNTFTPSLVLRSTASTSNNAQIMFTGPSGNNWAIGTDVASGSGSRDFHFYDLNSLTLKMVVQSSTGNVGIADSSPDDLLNIHSASAAAGMAITSLGTDTDPYIKFELADGTPTFSIGVDDSDSDKFKISTTALGTSDRLVIDSSGNVGIGDTSPDDLLNIHSATAAAGLAITSLGTDTDPYIKFELADGTPTFTMGVDDSDSDMFKISTTALGTSDRLVIDSSGNVGIGTASPTASLHIKAGTATANTAPLKFNSGTLLTTAEAGAVEFLTDAYYGTITTGAARKTFAFLESPSFTTPNIGAASGSTLTLSDDIIFSANKVIRRNTSDASDDGSIEINGGGAIGNSRGGGIFAFGNEHATHPGRVVIYPGNIANSGFRIRNSTDTDTLLAITGSNGSATFSSSVGPGATFTNTADKDIAIFDTSSANGPRIQLQKSGTYVVQIGSQLALTAAGSADQGMIRSATKLFLMGGNNTGCVLETHDSPTDVLMPTADSCMALGTTTKRYSDAHAINFYGTYNAGPDVAERYPASEQVEAGDVVMLDPNPPSDKTVSDQTNTEAVNAPGGEEAKTGNEVPVAIKKADGTSTTLGVISTAPGVTMNDPYDHTNPPVALVGRVPVKFSPENGSVSVGDRLTVSATIPGFAMKLTESGQSIGIALENSNGQDKILVFVNLGYYIPDLKIEDLASPTPAPGSFAEKFFTNLFSKITTWLADAGNGIVDIFAKKATLEEVCLKDVNGTSCYSRTQLDSLVAGAGNSSGGGSPLPPPDEPPLGDTTPPVITLTGESTINLNFGDTYTEEGATATDDVDVSITVVISGTVDTSTAGVYTIHYNATDTAGNNATEVNRTINVSEVIP